MTFTLYHLLVVEHFSLLDSLSFFNNKCHLPEKKQSIQSITEKKKDRQTDRQRKERRGDIQTVHAANPLSISS